MPASACHPCTLLAAPVCTAILPTTGTPEIGPATAVVPTRSTTILSANV